MELNQKAELMALALDSGDAAVAIIDGDHRLLMASLAARDLFELDSAAIGQSLAAIGLAEVVTELQTGDTGGPPLVHRRASDGRALSIELRSRLDESSGHRILTFSDVSDWIERLEESRLEALVDPLTGLPTWELVRDRLNRSLLDAKRQKTILALLILDLDGFHATNDMHGHEVGDEVLRQVSDVLQDRVRATDTVGRVGQDEFAVVLPNVGYTGTAIRVASELLDGIKSVGPILGRHLGVSASAGLAIFPDHGTSAAALRRQADSALHLARSSGGGLTVYSPEDDGRASETAVLANELRHGIEVGELLLHYQPKAHLKSGLVTRVEALVRWQHPTRGLLYPGAFISLAERTGQVTPLTVAVLDAALAQCRVWQDCGKDMAIAINLSPRTFRETSVPELIAASLKRWGVPAHSLKVEITEMSVLSDPELVVDACNALRDLGIRLALDDFGTGYSSLSHLRRLPVDEIKIDQSFVRDMAVDPDDAAIVQAVIDLSHTMGRQVVAEGCEDRQTWQMLRTMGCDLVQGYYLAKPMPPITLEKWLSDTRGGLLATATGSFKAILEKTKPAQDDGK